MWTSEIGTPYFNGAEWAEAWIAEYDKQIAHIERRREYMASRLRSMRDDTVKNKWLACGDCGTALPTEAAFYEHFFVKNGNGINQHLNLGDCPVKAGMTLVEQTEVKTLPKIYAWAH